MTALSDTSYPKHRHTWLEGSRLIVETAPYGETWPVRTVVDLNSQAVRNALIQAGWTPPCDGFLGAG